MCALVENLNIFGTYLKSQMPYQSWISAWITWCSKSCFPVEKLNQLQPTPWQIVCFTEFKLDIHHDILLQSVAWNLTEWHVLGGGKDVCNHDVHFCLQTLPCSACDKFNALQTDSLPSLMPSVDRVVYCKDEAMQGMIWDGDAAEEERERENPTKTAFLQLKL